MAQRKPRQIGTDAETATKRFMQQNGFPGADRRAPRGRQDPGDILVCPGVIAECKVRDRTISPQEIAGWMIEVEREIANSGAEFGFLVVRKKFANVALWPTYLFTSDIVRLHVDSPSDWTVPRRAIASMSLIDTIMMFRHCGFGEEP